MSLNALAALDVPFTETFDTQASFDAWLTVNTANDFYKWKWSKQSAYLSYNSSNSNDDWLISPELYLQAGVQYTITYSANTGYDIGEGTHERLAIAYGQGDEPSVYSVVMPTKELGYTNNKMVQQDAVTITPATTGAYRIGFHCTSPAWTNGLYLDDISVKADTKKAAPAAVSNLNVTPDEKGELKATVSFTTPTTTTDGSALSEISKVIVKRNGTQIDSVLNAATGRGYTFIDNTVPKDGQYIYSITAFNEAGAGDSVSDTVYVGQDVPLDPTQVRIKDNFDGTLTLSWRAPGNKGAHGNYVNTDNLKYIIYNVDAEGNPTPRDTVSTTSYVVRGFDNSGAQNWLYFGVASLTSAGHSNPGAQSEIYITGDPVQLPFIDSFANARPQRDEWWRSVSGFNFDGESADGDNGSARLISAAAGQVGDLNTGKVSLRGASNPKLLFKYYATPGKNSSLGVYINDSYQSTKLVQTIDNSSLTGKAGWRQAVVDLNNYKSEATHYILVRFIAQANEAGDTVRFDDVKIEDMLEYNVAVTGITAPKSVNVSQNAPVEVHLLNTGENAAESVNVSLYANNDVVATSTVPSISSLADTTVTFTYVPNAAAKDSVVLRAVVTYDLDFDETDNSDSVKINVAQNDFATVNDLTVSGATSGNKLNWTAPSSTVRTVNDDFESYAPWQTTDFGKWTAIDNDKQPTNGFAVLPHDGEPMAFITFHSGDINTTVNPFLASHSGDQCLVAWDNDSTATVKANDDWLISPELSGNEQTVSIWAKGMTDAYGYEKFEFLYSSTDKQMSSFTSKFGETNQVSSLEWTKYSAKLPQGTKYFAVHVISEQAFGLMLDDATFEAAPMKIKGYNIYRDGKLIGTVDGDATTFTDDESGTHDYQITVVYEDGESPLSNVATVTNGITTINAANTLRADAPMYNLAGQRVSASYKGVVIQNGRKFIKK